MDRQIEYVLRTVEERGVRFVRLWFTDVLGQLKSFAVSPAELEGAFEEGMQFDGSAIDGYSRIQESDVLARPDAATFEILPWDRKGETSARMFCDLATLSGEPFAGDPRQVLRRNLDAARAEGYSFFVAPEVEYFYFRNNDPTNLEPLDRGSYFDLTTDDVSTGLRRRTIQHVESMGIPVEYSFHEDSPSQHEIDLRHTDALTMADNVMTLRLVVRETAAEQGVHATFMPKPLADFQGSGMHSHLSLFKDDQNAFHDPDDPYLLSVVGRSFVAGLLAHAAEITAVTNQLVNSYKRLVVGTEAPSTITWARHHRAALVRVPETRAGREESVRIEYRSPDPACNPYLTFALLLAAGLDGVRRGLELPEEASSYLELSHRERAAAEIGVAALPQSLAEALDAMEGSDLVRETLGDHIFEWFLRNKRSEWFDYKTQVTPFELVRYLPTW
ncbi:MAG: glutamine synthetase [Acidimicrobiales bacterium]|nr:glutamine synthetase [Acidimicrobiales bacterium]